MPNLVEALIRSVDSARTAEDAGQQRTPARNQGVGDIAYPRTRVLELDRELLRENRVISAFEPAGGLAAPPVAA